MGTNEITVANLLIFFSLILVPILIFLKYKVKLVREIVISVLRMTVQLGFIGVFLKYIFQLNSPLINFVWILVMLMITNYTILRRSGLNIRKFFLTTAIGLIISTTIVMFFFIVILVKPDPIYDARYLIPITGMLLGNCLRGNILGLERFYSNISKQRGEYLTYLTLGATFQEAILPFMQDALKSALNPMIASIATIGLVSLPGMMTGQILGGSFPLTAIKYQLAIMIAIFVGMAISVVINLQLSFRKAFNRFLLLREDVFIKS